MTALQEARLPEQTPPGYLLQRLLAFARSTRLQPFLKVWADIAARGGRDEAPFQEIAQHCVEQSLWWLGKRLDVDDVDREDIAVSILAIVEGARQLEAFAPGVTVRVGQTLSGPLAHL